MSRPSVIYSLPKVYGVKSCVYKLSFDKKYVIVKCKDHEQSIAVIQKALNQFLRGSEFQRLPHNLYSHFFSYVEKHKEGIFRIEILLESDNHYELLKREQFELDRDRMDKKCLNNTTMAYIPQYDEITGLYGWLKKPYVMAFKSWLKSKKKPTSKQSQ